MGVVKLIDGRDRCTALRREAGWYDYLVMHYKALPHRYRYTTSTEFVSRINRDGNWVMGYRTDTYHMS